MQVDIQKHIDYKNEKTQNKPKAQKAANLLTEKQPC